MATRFLNHLKNHSESLRYLIERIIIPILSASVYVPNKAVPFLGGIWRFHFQLSNRRVGNPEAECVQDAHEAQMASCESTVQPRLFVSDERTGANRSERIVDCQVDLFAIVKGTKPKGRKATICIVMAVTVPSTTHLE